MRHQQNQPVPISYTQTDPKIKVFLAMDKTLLLLLVCSCLATDHVVEERSERKFPPLITESASRLQVFKVKLSGRPSQVELPCQASAVPPPKYMWYKDGEPLEPLEPGTSLREGSGTLVFHEPRPRHEGVYQCSASNELGTALSDKTLLKRAFLDVGPDEPEELSADIGTAVKLTCPVVSSFPDSVVYWTWPFDHRDMPVTLSDRVTQDYTGNLYIANVDKEDLKLGTFFCNIHNPVLGLIKRGKPHQLVANSVTERPKPQTPRLVWHSETNTTALVGHQKKMKCIFSGYPTPQVFWTKLDGPMTGKNKETDYGMELTNDDITTSDAGSYRCSVYNEEGAIVAMKDFHLEVESIPTWKQKPENTDSPEKGNVKFTCEADGVPKPAVHWSVNGVPLTDVPADPHLAVTETSVSFINLSKSDTQVLQCNISNIHGYIFTNAYLHVAGRLPSWTSNPGTLKVLENQDVNLICSADGLPKPAITWSKDNNSVGYDLNRSRFSQLQNGTLNILNVLKEDSGIYECVAFNKYGQISRNQELIVRERTRVRTVSVQVANASTAVVLHCDLTSDPDELEHLTTQWWHHGQLVKNNLQFNIDLDDHSLIIDGTMVNDTGNYTCVADNGLDSDEDTLELIIQDKPDPPRGVFITCDSTNVEVRWTWEQEDNNNNDIKEFTAAYNSSWSSDEKYHTVPGNYTSTRIQATPWTNYTVHIRAHNSLGWSVPSNTVSCATPSHPPKNNPTGVCVDMRERDQLVIVWEPIPWVDHGGEDFYYCVRYREANNPTAQELVVNVTNWMDSELVVRAVPTFHKYEFSVQAANRQGTSPQSQLLWFYGHSGEGEPLDSPGNLTVSIVNDTAAVFSWLPVEESPDRVRGHFLGYKIKYWKTDEPDNIRSHDVIKRSVDLCPLVAHVQRRRRSHAQDDLVPVTALVTDLWSSSTVTAGVCVLTSNKEGLLSPTIKFDTTAAYTVVKPAPGGINWAGATTSVIVAVLILIVIVIIIVIVVLIWHRGRGKTYKVRDRKGKGPDNSSEFSEKDFDVSLKKFFENSDTESMREYDDMDPKFYSDYGSFIGVYADADNPLGTTDDPDSHV